MIKSLLDADENDLSETKPAVKAKPSDEKAFAEFAAPFSEIEAQENALKHSASETVAAEVSEVPPTSSESAENFDQTAVYQSPFAEFEDETAKQTINAESPAETNAETVKFTPPLQTTAKQPRAEESVLFSQTAYQPESSAETIRKSGLAYTAAIILVASIVFTLIIGWFADLLLGTSPWGIVVGIVLGSIIGFIQFFRITSQILKDKD